MFQHSESDGGFHKELGNFSEEYFLEMAQNLPPFHQEEISIGILRDADDHISISRDSGQVFRLSMELSRTGQRSWKRLLLSGYISKKLHGLSEVKKVVRSYTEKSRSEFEREYT